ncbi:MAG: glucose-6-phosphate dehydrogenase [Proteobacteria bacterium]|nr:glucose-6-phosphate dehydrogenase [Pseudomonadota bacterium]
MNSNSSGPCYFVIFGATGNLASLKLLPALFHLEVAGKLNDGLRLIAFSRRPWSQVEWLSHMREVVEKNTGSRFDAAVYENFAKRFEYVAGDLHDPAAYKSLMGVISQPRMDTCENIVFYLAINPKDSGSVSRQLSDVGFSKQSGRYRIVVEKPFGEDIESARALNALLHRYFDEEQIFRIDHYLGKETVQNLLVFRFANTLIEPIWNRNYIDHVQITVAEQHGIGNRAGYYDHTGALRDMLQNHLMQLLTVVAMEPPAILEADALRDEKVKVLRSIRPIAEGAVHSQAIRAQYTAGKVGDEALRGYKDETGVASQTTSETYAAVKFYIDNWRWQGVPFYLRTGKRMAEPLSAVSIRFRQPPQQLFHKTSDEYVDPNWIVLSIQPEESMHIELHAKQPGLGMQTRVTKLNASYRRSDETPLLAYETLLLDVIQGDRSLFIRFDEVELAWQVVDPILRHWAQETEHIHSYPAGSWGPERADRLFDSDDQFWRNSI